MIHYNFIISVVKVKKNLRYDTDEQENNIMYKIKGLHEIQIK